MKNLRKILDSNELVFIDGSIKIQSDFGWDTYEKKTYESFDRNLLLIEKENILRLLEVLMHPSSRTIPEITGEMKEYLRIYSDKLRFLSRFSNCFFYHKERKRKSASKRIKKLKLHSCKITLLEELQEENFRLYHLCKQKELAIKDSRYDSLSDIVRLISRTMDLKKDNNSYYFKTPKNPYSSETDERLVSALYWISLYSEKNPSLVSGDLDFLRLLEISSQMFVMNDFMPYNEDFKNSLIKNPFKFYFFEKPAGDCLNEPFIFRESPGIQANILKNEKFPELKGQVFDLWKSLYEASESHKTICYATI